MTTAVAVLNLVMGLAYAGYGLMTGLELKRDCRSFGVSHFGAALFLLALTCGTHHIAHATHLFLEGRQGGALDLWSVALGLPFGVVWLYLRVESSLGGNGERYIAGTGPILRLVAVGVAVATVVMVVEAVRVAEPRVTAMAVVNALLVVLYAAVAVVLLRTQFDAHRRMHGWSLGGLSLAGIFVTCGTMHAVWAAYNTAGLYAHDVHGYVVDWAAVPATAYFLWVVRAIQRGALRDWNEGPDAVFVDVA